MQWLPTEQMIPRKRGIENDRNTSNNFGSKAGINRGKGSRYSYSLKVPLFSKASLKRYQPELIIGKLPGRS